MTTKILNNPNPYIVALKKDNAELTKQNYDLMKKYTVKASDPITNDVIDRIFKRHIQGMKKFKVTMADNPKTIDDWTEDTIEELIDAICYLVTMKGRIEKVMKNIKDQLRTAEGELSIIKGIGNNSPEMKDAKKEIEHLKKEMVLVREQAQIYILMKDQMIKKEDKLLKEIDRLTDDNQIAWLHNSKLDERIAKLKEELHNGNKT